MTKRSDSTIFLLLFLLAFSVDLLTPFLVWKGVLPAAVRWLSDLAVASMLVLAVIHMLAFDRIPRVAIPILGISLIGVTVALFEGQGIVTTAWGWWLFFRYLIVGLLAYLVPSWPADFARWLFQLCMVLLAFEVVVQLGQYVTGETPGDNLAGSFGSHGTSSLIIFILFVSCLGLGKWLTDGNWRWLVWVLALGGISSALGAMKLFPFAAVALGVIALLIHLLRGGQFHRLLLYLAIFGVIVLISASVYNSVVAEERGTKRLEEYLELRTLERYLNFANSRGGGRYELGRGFALKLGWQNIQRDTTTFLFGMGLGARGESIALNIAGEGLRQSYYGLISGTSLLVLMQELGVIGLVTFSVLIFWIIVTLFKHIGLDPMSDTTVLRYGLILFSIGWPMWLLYAGVWNMGVIMLLYWTILGYVLGESRVTTSKPSVIGKAHSSAKYAVLSQD